MASITVDPSKIHGQVAIGFEPVEDEFRKNFAQRADIGAACTVYHAGTKVATCGAVTGIASP